MEKKARRQQVAVGPVRQESIPVPPQLQDRRQMTALLARLVAMENKDRRAHSAPVRAQQEDTLMA
jgi:hypothetical protein